MAYVYNVDLVAALRVMLMMSIDPQRYILYECDD